MSDSRQLDWTLRCTECGADFGEAQVRYVCPRCSEKQVPAGPTRGILEVAWRADGMKQAWQRCLQSSLSGLDRFRDLLPLGPKAPRAPVLIGDTPLLEVQRLRERLGMKSLYLKDDTRNPSASYKDRASGLVCLKAAEYGESTIVAASTGNAATALACVAAAMGQRAVIFVPASAPRAKLVQMLCYGAQVVPVAGTYDEAFELSLQATRMLGWYNRNTAFNPFTIEGKKTSSLEVLMALGRAPDAVIVPTGDGVILSGIAKGYRDLIAAGAIERMPRLIAVQATGSASIARAVRTGGELESVPDAHTVADSICVSAPRAGLLAVREVRASQGAGVEVSDDAILEAIGELARYAAVFAEPAGAASLAGLTTALEQGLVSAAETVVLMVTGHGLKDVSAAARGVDVPEAIAPDAGALKQYLNEKGLA